MDSYAGGFDYPFMENSGTPPTEKDPVLVRFGEAVRRLRKARELSQEAFGAVCEIDRSYMGGIERGEHNLALINIMKIIKGLNMQPSEFFAELDELPQQCCYQEIHPGAEIAS